MRHSLQFHWRNQGYETFSDYLGALSGKRRRQILRERRQLEGWGSGNLSPHGRRTPPRTRRIDVRVLSRYVGRQVGRPLPQQGLLRRSLQNHERPDSADLATERKPLAGALFFLKDGSLFGRYWGAAEQRRNLHFELCYYQAIDFAIRRGFELLEAGAQGEHKLARGFLPSLTYSAHKMRDPAFGRAIGEYIESEKLMLQKVMEGVRLPRSLQTLSSPSIAARYYIDTRGWRALLRGGCIAWSSSGLSGRGIVG